MAKRALCILLAELTVFALAVPAFAEDASGSIGDDLKWSLSDGTVTVSGTGDMYEYYEPDSWKDNQDLFENVIIEPGVTGLRPNAFSYCENLKSVTLPDTLTRIGNSAFQECPGLTAVSIPGSVDTIEHGAFSGCENLKDVTIGKGVRIIRGFAFYGSCMTDVTIPDSVTLLDYDAFTYCQSLKSVTIPKSVVTIGGDAFYACTSLKDVTVLNPECLIEEYENSLGIPGTTVVHGYAGSTAETYAKTYGYTFKEVAEKPAAPTVKSAKAVSGGVTVTWGKVSGAAKYQVVYKTASGGWKAVKTTTTGTSYTVKGLKAGTKYTFSVRAISKDGTKGSYDTTGKSVKYTVEPAAPTVKSAKVVSGGVKVTWGKVDGAAKYQVVYKTTGGWKAVKTMTTDTSYTVKGLKSGTKYTFSVRAIAEDGTKGDYDQSGKDVTYTVKPAAPTVKSAKVVSGGVKVTWGKVSGAAKYQVVYKTTGGWKAVKSTTTVTSYTVKGLKSGTKYTFSVRAIGSDGAKGSYDTTGKTVTYTVGQTAPSVPAKPAQPAGTYVLNTNSMKFHYPTCASAAKISAANRKDVTTDRDALIAEGYVPCKVCKP